MYEYLINNETVIFENETDMLAGLKAAEEAEYNIELVRDDSMSKKADDTYAFGNPQKEDTFVFGGPTPEEQLRATQLEASSDVVGTSETAQEDFIQDPAESADVVSETPAQQDTELPQADTSSDLPKDDFQIKLDKLKSLKDRRAKSPDGTLPTDGESFEKLEEYENKKKFGIINSETGEVDEKLQAEVQEFEDFSQNKLNSGILQQLDVKGVSLQAKMQNGLQEAYRKYIKDNYKNFITTRTVGEVAVNTTKDKQMPNDFAIDQIVAEQLQTLQENQRNEKIAQEQKVGRGVSKNPTQKVISVIQNRIDAFPANEQLFGRTSQRLDAIDRKLAPGNLLTDNERIALEDERRALLISSAEAFEKMNPPGSTNPYRDGFEYVGKTQKNKLTQFFNLETGAQVMPAKAALSNKKIIAAPAEMLTEAERLAALPREPLKAAFYYNALKETQINGALKKTFNFNPNKAYERRAQKGEGVGMGPMDKSRLRVYLESKGYTPDENGLYTNVTAEDLLPLKDMNLSGRFGMFSEDGGSILDDAFVPREGDLATPAMFIQNLAEERMRNSIEGNALNRAYLLNIDPGSEKLEAGDYVATFGKKALAGTLDLLPDTMTSRYIDELPLTRREMLDNSEQMLMDAGIEITEEQKENFARGYGMKSVEQLGDFAPMLINFFFLNKAAGAAGMTRMIGTLMKGGPKQKAMGLIFGALAEEVKFEAATYGEAKTLGGTGFFAGGQVANALLKGRMGALARKILGGAVGGTAGSETAKVAESMAEDLMGDKDFKTSMQEYYGDIDEVTERLIIDGIVFGVLGMTHAKKIDFMKQSTKQKLSSKLNREINDMSFILTPKELGKKKKLKAELDQDLALNNEAFSKLAIGDQVQNAKAARARLNELDSQLKNDPFEGGLMSSVAKFEMWTERGMLENIISRVEANKMAARKAISEQANNFKESIGKPDMPVIITENGEGMGLGNKGEFQFETVKGKPSILIDLSLYQPGVLSQEGFHAQMEFAFGEGSGLKKGLNLDVAKKLREKIEPAVEKALENERFVISDGEGGTKNGTFKEAIEDAYKEDPAKTDEEYVANVIEFLGNKKYRNLLLDNSLMGKLNKAVKNTAIDFGISKQNVDQNLTTAEQTLDFLYTLSDFSQGPGRGKKNFAAFKNLAIDGTKLVDMKTNTEITTAKEMQKDISASKEIKPEEKKDIFSKATSVYEKMMADGESMDQIGVMVGYEFQPLVRSKLRSYLAVKGLDNVSDQVIEDIVSDVTLGDGKGGSQNIPGLVKSYKESGDASLTSYIFGQLNNKILGALQQPAYRDIFNTFSIDANPGQAERLAEGEGLGGGGISDGYVDLSSPEQNVRINRIKAEVALKLPVELKEDINSIGERLLMSTPLKNLEAKQEGSIELPGGKTAEIVISKSEQATIKIEGEATETIKVRSPKILEEKFGTGKKSFIKRPTTKEKLYRDGIDLIYPKLEKAVGGLKDNYTATPEYEAFVDNAYPLLKNYLSQSAVNKRFAEFKEPAIDKKTGKILKKKTSAGGTVFTKKDVKLAEWRGYFLGNGSKRIDGRRRSIIEAFSGEFVFDSVMESLSNETIKKQIESRQEDIGVELLDNFVTVIAKEIDRGNPGVMASKVIKIANEFGVDPYTMLFDKNNNLRPIDEIAMMPGGAEALGELYRGAQAELTRQLQNRAENQETNTVDKLDKYYKDNPELFTPEMREAVKEIRKISQEDFKNFDNQTDFLVTLFPEKMSEFSLDTVDIGVENSFLSQLFAESSVTNRATKTSVNRERFTDRIKGKIGTNYNASEMAEARKAWAKVLELGAENNIDSKIIKKGVKVQKGITVLKQQKEYKDRVEAINKTEGLTTAQKKVEIGKIKGYDAYRKAAELQVATLDAVLLTFGAASKMVKGTAAEQKAGRDNMFKALSVMLLNNFKGFRNLSPEIYYEIRDGGIKDPKNEHLLSKAEFASRVLIAFNEGRLNTLEEVKEVSSEYVSLVGERAVQKAADILMGPTAENNKEAKMLDFVKGETNREFSTSDLIKLDSVINLITGKSALQEMIEAQARKALNMPFRSATEALSNNNKILLESGMMTTDSKTTISASKKIINLDQAFEKGRDPNKEPKGISVFDFDDTLARTKSNVLYTMPDGTKGKLNATEFAKKSEALEAKGAEFDFSEFSKVVKGKLGPLFSEAKKKEGKYTNKDVFVLTARPANSAQAIYEFLKSEGLEIPIDNIVGLGNGAAKAKAEWMISKVAEGYNDFYFADDAIKNVEAVRDALGLFDVKSKVQQAIMASKKITLEKGLAEMIERKKGISSKEPISAAIASNLGKKKGRYDWFIPPNAEDFAGLMYKLYGKGKQGDKDMALIKEALIRPFNRAENAISTYKQTLGNDYSALESQMGDLKVSMSEETKTSLEQANVNADQATRVFIYNKLGYKIPGLEKNEIANISKIVNGDARLSAYAEGVMGITKTKEIFPRPGDTWYSSNIRYELFKYSTEGVRSHFLKDWQKNADEMFTEENFNRIEAAYGKNYTTNLKEMLSRMKTGKTRSADLGKDVQAGMDYVNGSVGVIMFLNTRSAVLQTISAVNYVNWSDNNPLQIGKAVAKPKEWSKTFMEIYNSDFLKQRRGGLEINVEEAEIAKAVERSKGNARNLYDSMIKIGFKPTQMADSFAIAFGGTPFLMNRTATYVKQGLSTEAARKRAFEDFREVSEESQQSSRQDRVSNIQTGVAGRLIFAFANTPMQMSRMTKKAALDLANGRGDAKTNISKMIYYGAVQSYIFYALQQSQFLRLFGGDDEDMTQEQKDFNKANNDKKNTRIANSMFDSFISGSGSPGKVAITAKNTIMKYYLEKEKGYKADYGNVINEALSISPPLSSKTKKIYSAFKTYKYYSTKQGQKELEKYGQYAFDNPMLMANAKVFSSVSNVPADRLIQKVNNLYSAFTDETLTPIQSAALAAGWDKWSLGLYDPKFMSEEEVVTNKAARKEQLKKEKIAKKEAAISSYDMKMSEPERREILKVLSKKQQMDSLGALEVSIKRRRELYKMKEIDRIEEIIRLQNKRQFYIETRNLNQTRQDSLK